MGTQTSTETPAAPAALAAPATNPETPAAAPAAGAPAAAPTGQPVAEVKEEKKEDAPQADPAAAKPPADQKVEPEAVSVKVPEGVAVNKALLDRFQAVAKEINLKGPEAQKIADVYIDMVAQSAEALKQYETKCVEALKADANFGGANFDKNVETAKTAFVRFGNAELWKELQDMGLGNHPGLMRFALNVGKAIAEDNTSARGGPASAVAPTDPNERLKQLYDKSPGMFR